MTDEREIPQSYILVTFAEINSTDMTINLVNVSPAQVLGAVAILEVRAKNAYIQMENERAEREAQMQIARPSDKILVTK